MLIGESQLNNIVMSNQGGFAMVRGDAVKFHALKLQWPSVLNAGQVQ